MCSFHPSFANDFYHKWCGVLSHAFATSTGTMMILFFRSVHGICHVDLRRSNHPCISEVIVGLRSFSQITFVQPRRRCHRSAYDVVVPVKLAERSWALWQSRGPLSCERRKDGEAHPPPKKPEETAHLCGLGAPIIPLPRCVDASAPRSPWRQLLPDPGSDRERLVL